jgi:acyl-CoA synthetase (AMP-forming)/AMP-acid ligase II
MPRENEGEAMRLHDYLEYRTREAPGAVFCEFENRSLTYREADAAANRLANALVAAGLGVGDRFAVLAKNCVEYLLIYYGASKAGVVPVPLNFRLAPGEWTYIVNDSEARLLIARGDLVSAISAQRGELPKIERWIAIDAGDPGWESWDDFVAGQPETPPDRVITDAMDLYQMYTSGTTGQPKGAVLPHASVCANVTQASVAFAAEPGERALVVAPLYHAAAALFSFVAVQAGGTIYLQEDFNPPEVVRALSEERIAAALLIPVMIQFCMLAVPDAADRCYDDLRVIIYGASAIAERTLREAVKTFRCDFIQAYGMTEVTAGATGLMAADHARALREKPELLASAGRPILGTEIRIVDENDQPVPNGTVGEILVRGPQLMRGYWNLPDATRDALRNGWMHTGDAGCLDDEGYLYIRDRVNDMIVSGGENVYPREIEEVLHRHAAVADAAAIGVPDETWGETVKAIVVLREGASATADEIIEFCKRDLGGFKRPRSVDFVDALPRNPTGKILKRKLREPYWKGKQRRVN